MKIAIVVPAHTPLSKEWINALQREALKGNADVIIVDDSDKGSDYLLGNHSFISLWTVQSYQDQKDFLGELYDDFAKMFHKSSACRVFGHILAYANGYDIIIGLDSDCIVPFNFVEDHLASLNTTRNNGWINPLAGSGFYPRGFPYSMRNWKTVANMGMWENVLDLNGKDRKKNEMKRISVGKYNSPSPIPFSGMNFALTRDVIFGFLFLPNFKYTNLIDEHFPVKREWDFRRIDDIWGGYIFQKLLHKMHLGVTYGTPIVWHDTVVVPEEDAKEEEAMYKYEDDFMNIVDDTISEMLLTGGEITINDYMKSFINEWKTGNSGFIDNLTPAFEWWDKVINKYANI